MKLSAKAVAETAGEEEQKPITKKSEPSQNSSIIEIILNDRLGKKLRLKCSPEDTVGDLKKILAAKDGTRAEKIRIQKWNTVFKDHITLGDYEVSDGTSLELYYN